MSGCSTDQTLEKLKFYSTGLKVHDMLNGRQTHLFQDLEPSSGNIKQGIPHTPPPTDM